MQPVMMMPPPGYYPPPPRRGGGFARGVLITLATTIFGASLMLNLYLLVAVGLAGDGNSASETVLVKGEPTETVAVIPLKGVITGESSERFDKLMRQLETNNSIKALVIELDTPGGEVTASDEIYRRINQYKKAKGVKVVATMGGMATSGGYYVACAADYIYAQPTTLTGNIGVVMQRFNFSELMDKWGVADTSVTPAGSKYKNVESPFRPETPETKAYLSGLIDHTYDQFKDIVKTGRGANLKVTIDQVADGRAYTADDALKLGLVDQIGYADDAYAKAAAMAGLSKQNVVRYHRAPTLMDLLGGGDSSAKFGGNRNASNSLSLGGVNVQVDRSILDELTTPRLMSIYRGE
jgi:protease-4